MNEIKFDDKAKQLWQKYPCLDYCCVLFVFDAMTRLKHKRLSSFEKIEILGYRQNNGNAKIRMLAEKLQVGKIQTTDIVSNKYEIDKA